MISIELFAEILIVGLLVLLALSPIIIRLEPVYEGADGILPMVQKKQINTLSVALFVMLTYTIGIAGSRLIDNLVFDQISLLDNITKEAKSEFKKKSLEIGLIAKSLKHAEFQVRLQDSKSLNAWLSRRKSYIRILEAASFSTFLFLLTMAGYRTSKPRIQRYELRHFIATAMLLVMFFTAYYLELRAYKSRLGEVYVELLGVQLESSK